ncbi:MAG: MATE family efflux transporter [Paludibacteraceae bacterium]
MNKQILRLAIPNIISNITIPLLGMVDVAIAGHLESPLFIGAMALGTTILSVIYWNFSFLRMGTSGFTAQAYGARDFTEMSNTLYRSLLVAAVAGLIIILLQVPAFSLAMLFIQSGEETVSYVGKYFHIVVWAAPAVLSMYVFTGWFIGMQNARTPMFIAILNNILNIILSISFVFGLGMKIEGIALGTMLSQWITVLITMSIWLIYYRKKLKPCFDWKKIMQIHSFKIFFRVNADIFIRTFLLVLVTTFFTFASSGRGDTILAVNSLLMQFFMLFSYFMDGFAYAGEALTGKFIGSGNHSGLMRLIRNLFIWGIGIAIVTVCIYLFFTPALLRILTNKPEIILAAKNYTHWTILIPLAGFAAFIWDGIYVGATASKPMRNSMIVAAGVFFICYYSTISFMGNNGLWLSFILYLFVRGLMQTAFFKIRKYFD